MSMLRSRYLKTGFHPENASNGFHPPDTPKKFKSATMACHFGFHVTSFSKASFLKFFSSTLNAKAKPAFSNSSGLKSVFVKLRFRDGLVWTEGLTVEIKLHFKVLRLNVKGPYS